MHVMTYAASIRALQPIILPTFEALQNGLNAAAEDHTRRSLIRKGDPWFYAHTVRRVASESLQAKGLQALDEGGRRPLLALSGLLVLHAGLAVRVLRAERADELHAIPVPGRSKRRQRFWRQEPLPGMALPGMEASNLLLLWDDQDNQVMEPLTVALPLGGDHRRDSLRLAWAGRLTKEMARLRVADLDELEPDRKFDQMEGEDTG